MLCGLSGYDTNRVPLDGVGAFEEPEKRGVVPQVVEDHIATSGKGHLAHRIARKERAGVEREDLPREALAAAFQRARGSHVSFEVGGWPRVF